MDSLTSAWRWHPSDHILHSLPLHHTHGIVNALYCAHAVGAAVEFLPKFSPAAIWRHFARERRATVFMGVPTMYAHLLTARDGLERQEARAAAAGAAALRLTVSGSAACPVPIIERWRALTGQVLAWLDDRAGFAKLFGTSAI